MSPIDDATLRDQLDQRVRATPLTGDEREQILGAIAAGRTASRRPIVWTTGGRWLAFAAAALSLILVVAVVFKPPTDQGSALITPTPGSTFPPGSSMATTSPASVRPTTLPTEPRPKLPTSSDAILTADQLAELALDPVPAGRVLLAQASVNLSSAQPADLRCIEPFCTIGLLITSAANVPVFVASEEPAPNASEVQAYRLLDDALEYLGPVAVKTGGADLSWSVADMRSGLQPVTDDVLYPVSGWLVEPVNDHECPQPPDVEPDAEYRYWCGSSWLSDERVYLDPRTTRPQDLVPKALQLQNPAYAMFAVARDVEGVRGAEPRHDVYLVREASCPDVRAGECPVWEIVGTLDAESAPWNGARADCFRSFTIADRATISSQQLAQYMDTIVIGTLASLGPGFWDSPDGRRPRSFLSMSDARLLTPLNIAVDRTLKGSASENAAKPGGTYGCDTSNYDPEVRVNEGDRYVFFLLEVVWSGPGATSMLVAEAWPIGIDGRVRDPRTEDVRLTLDELGPYLFRPEPTLLPPPRPSEPGDDLPG